MKDPNDANAGSVGCLIRMILRRSLTMPMSYPPIDISQKQAIFANEFCIPFCINFFVKKEMNRVFLPSTLEK